MKRLLLAVATMGLLGIGLTPSARADQWSKRTILTVNETITVPGATLAPGQYVVRLLDSKSDRNIVQIFNADENEVLTTILAIPNYRLNATADSVFTFWEMPPGQPKALRAWFYPGDNFGQEFAYPKTEAVKIAAATHTEVAAEEAQKPEELAQTPIEKVEPPETVAEAPAAEAPVQEAEALPEPTPAAPVAELPKTASPLPLIGLLGISALGMALMLRVIRAS